MWTATEMFPSLHSELNKVSIITVFAQLTVKQMVMSQGIMLDYMLKAMVLSNR